MTKDQIDNIVESIECCRVIATDQGKQAANNMAFKLCGILVTLGYLQAPSNLVGLVESSIDYCYNLSR